MLHVKDIKTQFPLFKHNPNLVYLDSASTALTHQSVIDKLVEYYEKYPANVKRGIYTLSEKSTEEFEDTRKTISSFINANHVSEVVFTRGTTESINLVAYALGRKIIDKNDEIVVSIMEHHSNFVPWQVLAQETGAVFKVIDIGDRGRLNIFNKDFSKIFLEKVITKKTKILALTYVSNVLGTINPIKEIINQAKTINPKLIMIIDAAQAVPHLKIDVQDLNCDFLAFSGHKMFGPKGVGILWGKRQLLNDMFPFQYGGEMIEEVKIERTTYARLPEKFEAGTPSIADVIALKEAVKFIQRLGFKQIQDHEESLVEDARTKLLKTFGSTFSLYGPRADESHTNVISFNFLSIHPHDIASLLNQEHICIRAGHHCAMPLHRRLGVVATCRASFSVYNDEVDIDNLIKGLLKAKKLFSKT